MEDKMAAEDERIRSLSEHFFNRYPHLKKLFWQYTHKGDEFVNKYLRGEAYDTTKTWDIEGKVYTTPELAQQLSAAFTLPGIPVTKHPTYFWRGTGGDFTHHRKTWVEKAFLSTSAKQYEGKQFAVGPCCLFKVSIPAGTPVLNMISISNRPWEDEFLLHPGTVLQKIGETVTQHAWTKDPLKQYNVRVVPVESKGVEHKTADDKILNPATGRWVLKGGRIGRRLLSTRPVVTKSKPRRTTKTTTKKTTKATKNKSCPKGKIINPASGRCVSKDGRIGRKLLGR